MIGEKDRGILIKSIKDNVDFSYPIDSTLTFSEVQFMQSETPDDPEEGDVWIDNVLNTTQEYTSEWINVTDLVSNSLFHIGIKYHYFFEDNWYIGDSPWDLITYGNTYDYTPVIIRTIEDYSAEEDQILITFTPTGKKIGTSLSSYAGTRSNPNYTDYGYGEEEICKIMVMARTSNGIHGRYLCTEWLKRIEKYIRLKWELLVNKLKIMHYTFTPYIEMNRYLAGKQYVYEMSFKINSHHGWSNEPIETPQVSPDIVGVDVQDIIIVWDE